MAQALEPTADELARKSTPPIAATVPIAERQRPVWFRRVLDFDAPGDVARFDRFSNLRERIRVLVGPGGRAKKRITNGAPHPVVEAQGA